MRIQDFGDWVATLKYFVVFKKRDIFFMKALHKTLSSVNKSDIFLTLLKTVVGQYTLHNPPLQYINIYPALSNRTDPFLPNSVAMITICKYNDIADNTCKY